MIKRLLIFLLPVFIAHLAHSQSSSLNQLGTKDDVVSSVLMSDTTIRRSYHTTNIHDLERALAGKPELRNRSSTAITN